MHTWTVVPCLHRCCHNQTSLTIYHFSSAILPGRCTNGPLVEMYIYIHKHATIQKDEHTHIYAAQIRTTASSTLLCGWKLVNQIVYLVFRFFLSVGTCILTLFSVQKGTGLALDEWGLIFQTEHQQNFPTSAVNCTYKDIEICTVTVLFCNLHPTLFQYKCFKNIETSSDLYQNYNNYKWK